MFSAACGGAVRPGQGRRVGSGAFVQPGPAQQIVWPVGGSGGPDQAPKWLLCLPFQDSKQLHVAAADQPGAGAEAVPHGEGHPPMPTAPSTLVPGSPALTGHRQPRCHPLAQAEAGSHALFPDTQTPRWGWGWACSTLCALNGGCPQEGEAQGSDPLSSSGRCERLTWRGVGRGWWGDMTGQ